MPRIITARSARTQHPGPETLNELLARFRNTPEVRDIESETARALRRATKRISARFGALSIEEVEDPAFRTAVYDWRDELSPTRYECTRTVRTLARVLAWGVDRRVVRINQAEGIRFRWGRRPVEGNRSDIVWAPDEIETLRRHGGVLTDAIELTLWTGLRQSDVRTVRKDRVKDGWLVLTPQKTARSTGIVVKIPYTRLPPLHALIDRLLISNPGSPLLVGTDWAPRVFRSLFEQVKKRAGMTDLDRHFHDLRGTFITFLAEAGCSEIEIASVSGHLLARGSLRAYMKRVEAYPEAAYDKLRAYMEEEHDDWYSRP